MEKLSLYTDHNSFLIQTERTDLPKLRIACQEKTEFFEKISPTTWKITGEQLNLLHNTVNRNRLFLYYTDNKQEINASRFEIDLGPTTALTIDKKTFYGYVSLGHNVRFVTEQLPSAKSYYQKNQPLEIKATENKIKLKIAIETKYAALTESSLIISNRQEGHKFNVLSTKIETSKIQPNIYQNICTFLFSSEEFLNTLRPTLNYNDFDATLIDFYFTICIKQTPITNYKFRVPFSKEIKTETWCSYTNKKMFLLYFYQTVYGNLSARIGVTSKEVYKEYCSLLKTVETKNNNNIVLICEYPHKAQDNGLFFFQYLMEKQNKFIPYYIITENSKDLFNLRPYMEHVVYFKSKKHLKLLFEANYLMHTHTSNYILPFLTKELEIRRKAMKKIFLQHGITATKNVESFYGKQSNPDMTDKFLVSSKRELEQVHNQLKYPINDISITGLARFDLLLKGNNFIKTYLLRKKILIMPTWRKGKNYLSDEEFKQTKFFNYFSNLINDPTIEELVQNKKITVDFYLHSNFQKYTHLFESNTVNILREGDQTVQDLLKSHGILITDYSSVGLDFVLQQRKVLYFQFDNDIEELQTETDEHFLLPGPIFKTKQQLIIGLQEAINNNKLTEPYLEIVRKQLYSYKDTNACRRIYEVLDNM